MFKFARIRLTAWYLIIIMLVSVSFSLVVYRLMTFEYERFLRMQRNRLEFRFGPPAVLVDPDLINEAHERLIWILLGINGGVVLLSGVGGWVLSGRTLKPIQRAMDDQKRFISDASHELKTPIASLKTAQEVALRDTKATKEDYHHVVTQNLDDLNRLERLTLSLLELSKDNSSNQRHFNLTQLLKDSISKFHAQAKINKQKIEVDIANELHVFSDPDLVAQIVTILVDNALKYSPKGKTVRIISFHEKNSLCIKVVDQGLGIDPSNHQKIFTRFYRADESRNQNTPGFGLGLSIAQKLTKKLKGQLSLQSEVGKGSIFILTLPLQAKFS